MTGRVDRGACSSSTDCLATERILSRLLDEIFSVDDCVLLGKIAGRRWGCFHADSSRLLRLTERVACLKSEKYVTTHERATETNVPPACTTWCRAFCNVVSLLSVEWMGFL